MLLSIQYLRAVAAMMVVVFHAAEAFGRLVEPDEAFRFTAGLAGVDIFFVISGFVMGLTTQGRDVPPIAFLRKRIVRIVPLYWLLTLFVANVAIVRPDLLSSTVFDARHLLASLVFWPVVHPALNEILPLLIPGWTLNYEMAFYVLVAVSLVLPRALRTGFVLLVLALAIASREHIPYRPATDFYTMPLIFEFGAGLLLARAHAGGSVVRPGVALFAMLVGAFALLALAGTGLWRFLAAGLPAVLVVSGAIFLERGRSFPRWRLPVLLGDASYSIYLTHALALPLLSQGWRSFGLSSSFQGEVAFLLVAVTLSALVGIAVHLAVEKPLLVLLTRPSHPRPVPAGLPA
ncbi:hypothetical protein ASG43_06405 [Aureimonas sp. Leaf454]|uniref:acyltransferase family protein n=1 Tax=Aureimonas sp. Leaf454 TaxID=1736381 RepID=UPI0006FC8ADF|nr:acyltransferase [Aureimonas sp. Leaf454]KQT50884.1 hypothetical protein ASG43_06405 [Aureimonas sp. Leaf454]